MARIRLATDIRRPEMTERNEICELTDTELEAVSGGKGAWEAAKDKAALAEVKKSCEREVLLWQLQ
jgi:bacteriocin-like protein